MTQDNPEVTPDLDVPVDVPKGPQETAAPEAELADDIGPVDGAAPEDEPFGEPIDESGAQPQPPAAPFSGLVALVSPVSSKKNFVKCEPGWNSPFSGRLNGVAPAALARSIATNGALPSTAVSWIVTQRVSNDLP